MNIYKTLLRRIHFIGIGGIGMSALAKIFRQFGCEVSGSDAAENANCKALEQIGVRVFYRHEASNVSGASFVVFSSAIAEDNPEMVEARRLGLRVIHRSMLLSMFAKHKFSIGVSGSHGKTTTTSVIYHLLNLFGYDPSFISGGIDVALGSNAKLGSGELLVLEADESDGSFLNLKPDVAIVTNISREHLKFYGTFENLVDSFHKFIQGIPFYGGAIVSLDDPYCRELVKSVPSAITFGLSEDANVRAFNIVQNAEGSVYDLAVNVPWLKPFTKKGLKLPLLGLHNVHNSLAGFVLLLCLGHEFESDCLAGFKGVKRRCELLGKYKGASILDDYAVHPNEIKAVLDALKSHSRSGRIIAVLQPHRYSRLFHLFDEFLDALKGADMVYITDVFSAWEDPIEGISGLNLALKGGHTYVDSYESLRESLQQYLAPQDLVLFFGAGNITSWSAKLVSEV